MAEWKKHEGKFPIQMKARKVADLARQLTEELVKDLEKKKKALEQLRGTMETTDPK